MPDTSQDYRALRVAFAGTPDFAALHLQALIAAKANIVAVYTQPDRPAGRGKKLVKSPVKQLAEDHQLPVLQPASLRDDESQAEFADVKPDVFVVVAYGLLIPQAVLDIPRHGCINVHASLLPRWRGAAPIQRAIEAGDRETGVTIMQMDAGLDTGDMLAKVSCPIASDETGGSLHDKLAAIGPPALLDTLTQIARGTVHPQAQDDTHTCYASKISKREAAIDWRAPAAVLDAKIRAFNPFPICHTELEGKSVRIWAAPALDKAASATPGTILKADDTGIDVVCGAGVLSITQAQLPGKKCIPVADILRGNSELFAPGKCFGGLPS